MPFDGNGNWTADFSAVADRDANIEIMASRFDNIHQADLKESFENCLTKDMQVKPLQNFNANNFRIINVSNPVQDNDAVNKQTLSSTVSASEASILNKFVVVESLPQDPSEDVFYFIKE